MRLFNETVYQVSHRLTTYEPGRPFMTTIVKGTFRLVDGGPCTALPEKEQTKPGRPKNFSDVHGNSRMLPGDLAPYKPTADCLFIGSAHAPHGRPVTDLEVVFGVGPMRKALTVFGNRWWEREADGGARLTQPEPFTEMPIRAEYAHGGYTSQYNMHGIGFGELDMAPGSTIPAANVMPHGAVFHRWTEDGPFAGFGVVPSNKLPRRTLLGTFDAHWQTRRKPLPPEDFDPAFFNGAPVDQQIEGYLAGDEEIYLRNLHPGAPEFRSYLPGTAVKLFVNRHLNPDNPKELEFAEVAVVLDTCIVNVPEETVTLVWRGTVGTATRRESLIDHMLLVEEPLDAQAPLSAYAELLRDRLIDKRAEEREAEEAGSAAKVAEVHATGIDMAVRMLTEGGAPADLIEAVGKQKTLQDAKALIEARIEQIAASLPKVPRDG